MASDPQHLSVGAAQGAWKYLLHAGGGQGAAFLIVAVPHIFHDLN